MVRQLHVRHVALVFVLVIFCGGAMAADGPGDRAGPKMLTAYAYVSVKPIPGAGDEMMAYTAETARSSIPGVLFKKLTVVSQGTVEQAMERALKAGADVFLHLRVNPPKKIKHTFRAQVWNPSEDGSRMDGKPIMVLVPVYFLRTYLTVEMSVATSGKWKRGRRTKFSSADAPPAEAGMIISETDIEKNWTKGLKITVPAAIGQAINKRFFRGVTMRIFRIRRDSSRSGKTKGGDNKPSQVGVQIELSNRSRTRIVDPTVTVQHYDGDLKRWEPIASYFDATMPAAPKWTFSGAAIEPGGKGVSEWVMLSLSDFRTLKKRKCRFILRAGPIMRAPAPARSLHPLDTGKSR